MPLCVGHEVIGRAIKVGSEVKTIKVGDRVGVGAQIRACLDCDNCKADQENYCPNCKNYPLRAPRLMQADLRCSC